MLFRSEKAELLQYVWPLLRCFLSGVRDKHGGAYDKHMLSSLPSARAHQGVCVCVFQLTAAYTKRQDPCCSTSATHCMDVIPATPRSPAATISRLNVSTGLHFSHLSVGRPPHVGPVPKLRGWSFHFALYTVSANLTHTLIEKEHLLEKWKK